MDPTQLRLQGWVLVNRSTRSTICLPWLGRGCRIKEGSDDDTTPSLKCLRTLLKMNWTQRLSNRYQYFALYQHPTRSHGRDVQQKALCDKFWKKENNLSQIIVFHHLAMFHQYSNKPFADKNNNQYACIHWNKMIKNHQIWMKLNLLQNNVNILPAIVSFLSELYSSSSVAIINIIIIVKINHYYNIQMEPRNKWDPVCLTSWDMTESQILNWIIGQDVYGKYFCQVSLFQRPV